MEQHRLSKMKAFFFDLDGCIYRGGLVSEGAKELISRLEGEGRVVGYVTNNSRETAEDIAAKLLTMGIRARVESIVTTTEFIGVYMYERYGYVKAKVIGSDKLQQFIAKIGHCVVPYSQDEHVDMVILGRDTEFTYDKLFHIVAAADRGAGILATNPDMYHPGEGNCRIPETGALTASVEAIFHSKIDYVGKPALSIFQHSMTRYNVLPHESVMIGDTLDTDIIGGHRAGMITVLLDQERVLRQMQVGAKIQADFTVTDLVELYDLIYGHGVLLKENDPAVRKVSG